MPIVNDPNRQHTCSRCKLNFKQIDQLIAHQRQATRKWVCRRCGKSYASVDAAKKHDASTHQKAYDHVNYHLLCVVEEKPADAGRQKRYSKFERRSLSADSSSEDERPAKKSPRTSAQSEYSPAVRKHVKEPVYAGKKAEEKKEKTPVHEDLQLSSSSSEEDEVNKESTSPTPTRNEPIGNPVQQPSNRKDTAPTPPPEASGPKTNSDDNASQQPISTPPTRSEQQPTVIEPRKEIPLVIYEQGKVEPYWTALSLPATISELKKKIPTKARIFARTHVPNFGYVWKEVREGEEVPVLDDRITVEIKKTFK